MITAGIIAEYNPFHNGHKFHIEETRRRTGADCIVAVMSGDFVQRGEPAVYNKWQRARAAVLGGADLVLELPVIYSCAGAEFFAKGAVRLMSRLGAVDFLSFGAEEADLSKLEGAASVFSEESEVLGKAIRQNLKAGLSYAVARSRALEQLGMDEYSKIISEPNNILAVEYLKQINKLKKAGLKALEPVCVKRKSAGYYEQNPAEGVAGAGNIRDLMRDGAEVSAYLPFSYSEKPCFRDSMFEMIAYRLLSDSAEALSQIDSVVEGIENRCIRAAREASDYEGLVNLIKSKRYSRTSVQRMLLRILLGIKKTDMRELDSEGRAYARVLGFSSAGARLIKQIKKNADPDELQVITNINRQQPKDELIKRMLDFDIKAAMIYDLLAYGCASQNSDHRIKPFSL